jgi:hypothetical protein
MQAKCNSGVCNANVTSVIFVVGLRDVHYLKQLRLKYRVLTVSDRRSEEILLFQFPIHHEERGSNSVVMFAKHPSLSLSTHFTEPRSKI